MSKAVTVTITTKTILRIIGLILATMIAVIFVRRVGHAITLIFFALFLALALNPAVSFISKKLHIKSRAGATAIAYIAVIALLIGFFSIIVPPLWRQTADFVSSVPSQLQQTKDQSTSIGRFVYRYNLQDSLDSFAKDIQPKVDDISAPVLATANKVGSTVISIITVLVLTFMMIVEGPGWLNAFWQTQPANRRERRKAIAAKMYGVVTNYVNGQILLASIAAFFALTAMIIASSVTGVTVNAVGLAGIIALTGLIPMIGNTIGAVFVVIVCLFSSLPLAIIMAVFFLIYQQVENATLQPYIQSRKNELTPLLVFVAALLGIGLGGLLGGFVAIPVAGCIKILFNDVYEDRLRSMLSQNETSKT